MVNGLSGFNNGIVEEEERKEQEDILYMNPFITYGCDRIFSSTEEDLGVESWNQEHKGPDNDVVEEPERAVDGASKSPTGLRGVVEVIMIKTEEKENIKMQYKLLSTLLQFHNIQNKVLLLAVCPFQSLSHSPKFLKCLNTTF